MHERAHSGCRLRAGDQVCAVGVYDADEAGSAPVSLKARIKVLRQLLAAGMPDSLSADWAAYQMALDEQTAMLRKVREQLHAADAALAMGTETAESR